MQFEHTLESARQTIRRFRAIASTAVIILGIGTVFYHFVEHWRWLDSLYFCVMSLVTIGVNDVAPRTTAGKIFTMVYVLVGIGILAAFANNILKTGLARRYLRQNNEQDKVHTK